MSRYSDSEPTIAMDFDNTITTSFELGSKIVFDNKAVMFVRLLHKYNVKFILWTCREDKWLEEALTELKKLDLLKCFIAINDNTEEQKNWKLGNSRKIYADYLIDDLSIDFTRDWLKYLRVILSDNYFKGDNRPVESPSLIEEEYLRLIA